MSLGVHHGLMSGAKSDHQLDFLPLVCRPTEIGNHLRLSFFRRRMGAEAAGNVGRSLCVVHAVTWAARRRRGSSAAIKAPPRCPMSPRV